MMILCNGYTNAVPRSPPPAPQVSREECDVVIASSAAAAFGVGPASGTVNASTPLDLPASVAAGFVHQLHPRWTVMGDVTWTGWSTFEEIRVSADGFPDAVTTADWDDTWRVSLGLAFDAYDQWTLRGGVMFDQSPIPDAHARSPRIPGADRYWGSVGASWRLSHQLTIDLAYSHLFFKDAAINNTVDLAPTAAPGAFTVTLLGSTDAGVDAIGVGIRYQFN